jgi:hypothetical protein
MLLLLLLQGTYATRGRGAFAQRVDIAMRDEDDGDKDEDG